MRSVRFLGKVLPSVIEVTIDFRPTISWDIPEVGKCFQFTCIVEKSSVEVRCEADEIPDHSFIHLYMRSLDLVRGQVDLLCFREGYGLTVTLDSYVNQEGQTTSLLATDNRLAQLSTSLRSVGDFDTLCIAVMTSVPLMHALRDLVTSITLPHVSCVDCARAIERIKHLISPNARNDGEAWKAMQDALRLTKDYLTFITQHSKDSRHGRSVFVSGEITSEVARRSWVVMDRYLELIKSGSGSLPIERFPIV